MVARVPQRTGAGGKTYVRACALYGLYLSAGVIPVWLLVIRLESCHVQCMSVSDEQGLSEAEWHFVRLYVHYGRESWAAREAGYSEGKGKQLLRDQRVSAAISAETRRKLNRGASMALRRIEKLMNDSSVSDNVRLQAAKDWLDRAGYKPEHNFEDPGSAAKRRDRSELLSRVKELQQNLGIANAENLGELQPVEENESSGEAETPSLPPTEDAPPSEPEVVDEDDEGDAADLVDTFNVDVEDL